MNFKLSASGKMTVTLMIALTSSTVFAAPGIVAAGDALHLPDVTTARNGALVVNIVAPNASGLSHNQYKSFNVNTPGAVLNNSTSAGQSVLAGQLQANGFLHGQAASIILNEVISRNPSLLLGAQEIFGMAADYVLANPNGITCDGCGFINTNSATLAVATPLLKLGAIDGYSTTNNSNSLNIGNAGLHANQVLQLIAPTINSRGVITAQQSITAITGQNIVDQDAQLVKADTFTDSALDSYYLGSMQAGKIKIVNTAAGSGVNLGGSLTASASIDVDAAGELSIEAAKLRGDDINLTADTLRTKGKIVSEQIDKDGDENYKNYRGAIDVNQKETHEKLIQTEIEGKNITLIAAQENRISATNISGDTINLTGGSLVLDGQKTTQTVEHTDDRWFYSWVQNKSQKDVQEQQHGTHLNATKSITMTSEQGDLSVSGAQLIAQDGIRLTAKKDIMLDALVADDSHQEKIYHKNHTAKLLTGTQESKESKQTLTASKLSTAGSVQIIAGGNITAQATQINAGDDLTVLTEQTLTVGVQQTVSEQLHSDDKKYWGGIGGGSNSSDKHREQNGHASVFQAGGEIIIAADAGVKITGSQIKSEQGGIIHANEGEIVINNTVNTSTDSNSSRNGTIFNITNRSGKSDQQIDKVFGSEVVAETSLDIVSGKDVTVRASTVNTHGSLNITSAGDINIDGAADRTHVVEEKTALTAKGYAEKDGNKQYKVGFDITHNRDKTDQTSTQLVGSTVTGGDVNLHAADTVTVTGSDLNTTVGDANISAKNVAFLADEDTTVIDHEHTAVGGGLYFSGGIEKGRVAAKVDYTKEQENSSQSTAKVSHTDIAGDLNVHATEKVTQQGTQHDVAGTYRVSANELENLAAEDSLTEHNKTLKVGVEVGVEVNYAGVTKPIEGAIETLIQLDVKGSAEAIKGAVTDVVSVGKELIDNKGKPSWSQATKVGNAVNTVLDQDIPGKIEIATDAIKEIGGAIKDLAKADFAMPQAGVDVATKVTNNQSDSHSTQAKATQIKAGIIEINVANKLHDQGTDYQASDGSIEIRAREHQSESAFNTTEMNSSEISGGGSVQVATSTGHDIKVGVQGNGSNKQHQQQSKTAQVGHITAKNGVNIKVEEDASYQGTHVDGGQGKAQISAGNDLTIEQATNSSSDTGRDFDLAITAKVGVTPNAKDLGGSIKGGYANNVDSTTEGVVSELNGQGGVELKAGRDLTLQGSQIGSTDQQAGSVTIAANGQVNISAATATESHEKGRYAGNLNIGGGQNQGDESSVNKGNLGMGVVLDHSANTQMKETGAVIASQGDVSVTAGAGNDQALSLKGTQMDGLHVDINAENGGVVIVSADDENHGSGWNFGLNLGGDMASTTAKTEATDSGSKLGGAIGLKGGYEKQDSHHYDNSRISGTDVNLDSAKDFTLTGANVSGQQVTANVAGGLQVDSQLTHDSSYKVGLQTGIEKKADAAPNKNSVIQNIANDIQLKGEYEYADSDTVTEASSISSEQGVTLNVAGDTQLTSSDISSEMGNVALNTRHQTTQSLKENQKSGKFGGDIGRMIRGFFSRNQDKS
ncbi:hemagglutinin repeat-containing protein [Moritella yayanosii]|uniref:Putative Hemolysin n=1 Tax=Moritella yayanosii TaxID=69539 RepID=A0A330LLQ6_9GAMM|nr:hemagglutinin repeat-containing protein [Moritella yayanosii]SQD76921.1 putative Hemolysin [Moritella yayanosii]